MKEYVEIKNGCVNPIKIDDDKVNELKTAGLDIRDVSELETKPYAGWVFNEKNKEYTAPVEKLKQQSPAELYASIDQENPTIKDVMKGLNAIARYLEILKGEK